MGWLIDRPGAEEHEGYVAMLGPDGRSSGGTGREGVLFPNPRWSRDSAEPFDIAVPWPEITGWRVQCECGWRGTTWRREDARNDDPDADDMYPDRMLLPDGRTLEDVGEEEWVHHVRPLAAADGVRAAALALGQATAALDAAVVEARESDPPATWEQIGRAAGITRQSAHDRWAGGPRAMEVLHSPRQPQTVDSRQGDSS